MDNKQKLDEIAKRGLCRSVLNADFFYNITKYDIDAIGDLYVMWQNRKKVQELALEELTQDHEEKIEYFKNIITSSTIFITTILSMRKDENSPIVVTDGIHRIIGAQRAIIEQPNLKRKIKISMLLFEGGKINEIPDYTLSIPI